MTGVIPNDAIALRKLSDRRFTLWCSATRCVWNTDDDPSGDTCSCTKDEVHLSDSGYFGVGCSDLEEDPEREH